MIAQAFLFVTGVVAIWLSQSSALADRKWAPIVGLIAQPVWLYVSWSAGQWGIFALTFFYTAAWLRGFKTHWYKPLTEGL